MDLLQITFTADGNGPRSFTVGPITYAGQDVTHLVPLRHNKGHSFASVRSYVLELLRDAGIAPEPNWMTQ